MKFDVLNRFAGAVQFTAEIDCADDAPTSIKLGLAVRWGVKEGANLIGANLIGANLIGANLIGANLDGASLIGANLIGANLDGASLNGASLNGANLIGANLDGASLNGASLIGANLDGASLNGASLNGASLNGANIDGANLIGANLIGANLDGAKGINDWIKCIQIDTYPITYTSEVLQIGCQRHPIAAWAAFSDAEIRNMDGAKALAWRGKYKDWIFATIAMCPAKPTGYQKAEAAE
jgi:hypothetical protein